MQICIRSIIEFNWIEMFPFHACRFGSSRELGKMKKTQKIQINVRHNNICRLTFRLLCADDRCILSCSNIELQERCGGATIRATFTTSIPSKFNRRRFTLWNESLAQTQREKITIKTWENVRQWRKFVSVWVCVCVGIIARFRIKYSGRCSVSHQINFPRKKILKRNGRENERRKKKAKHT